MNAIRKQSIEHSIRENFKLYPESYPLQEANNGISPTDDAISSLADWVEREFKYDETEDKGDLSEWFEIAIGQFIDFFEIKDGDFDEQGETRQYIIDQIKHITGANS